MGLAPSYKPQRVGVLPEDSFYNRCKEVETYMIKRKKYSGQETSSKRQNFLEDSKLQAKIRAICRVNQN